MIAGWWLVVGGWWSVVGGGWQGDLQPLTTIHQPVLRFQRDQRVLAPERDHSIEVAHLWDLAPDQAIAQATKLIAIQVADELVHELGPRGNCGANTVSLELLEHVGAIAIGRHRCDADPARHSARRRNVRASPSSDGSPPDFGHPLTRMR